MVIIIQIMQIKLAVKQDEEFDENQQFENNEQKKHESESPIHRITVLKQLSIASILSEHKSPSKTYDNTLIMDCMSPINDLIISTIDKLEEFEDKTMCFCNMITCIIECFYKENQVKSSSRFQAEFKVRIQSQSINKQYPQNMTFLFFSCVL